MCVGMRARAHACTHTKHKHTCMMLLEHFMYINNII